MDRDRQRVGLIGQTRERGEITSRSKDVHRESRERGLLRPDGRVRQPAHAGREAPTLIEEREPYEVLTSLVQDALQITLRAA